jgi:hypothetical protein
VDCLLLVVLLLTTAGQLVLVWLSGRIERVGGGRRREDQAVRQIKQTDRQAGKQAVRVDQSGQPISLSINRPSISQFIGQSIPLGQTPFDRGISCKRGRVEGGEGG